MKALFGQGLLNFELACQCVVHRITWTEKGCTMFWGYAVPLNTLLNDPRTVSCLGFTQ